MLPADLLSRCAEFCQDAAFCALRGSSGQWFAATTPAKTARTRYAFTVTLRGRAECRIDAKRVMKKLQRRAVKRFLADAHYYPVDYDNVIADQVVTVTFRAARREKVPLMHHAAHQFLRSLRTIPDGHIMRESTKFADEFNGERDSDLDWVACRLPEKTAAELLSATRMPEPAPR